MTALTTDRSTPRRERGTKQGGVAATVQIFQGALVMRNAAGYLTKGQMATGLVGVGRAEQNVLGGASAGDVSLTVREGVYPFANSASTDQITIAQIGKLCYAVDDQTVAKTDNSGARSPAGIVEDIDPNGQVWVRLDEALTNALVS